MPTASEFKELCNELAREKAELQKEQKEHQRTQGKLQKEQKEHQRTQGKLQKEQKEHQRTQGKLQKEQKEHQRTREELAAEKAGRKSDNAVSAAQIATQTAQIKQFKQRITYYENPHSPSSQNSIPTRQKKAAAAAGASGRAPTRPGRRPGHEGISHRRTPTREMNHVPDMCGACNGRDLTDPVPAGTRMATDIPEIPEPVTTQHYFTRRKCRKCGAITTTNGGGLVVPGTEFGPNIASYIGTLYTMPASVGSIRRIVKEIFEIDVSKAMIQNCLKAVAKKLDPCVEDIKKDIAGCDHVHMDETGMPYDGKSGYMWVAVGVKDGNAVGAHMVATDSRRASVLDEHFSYVPRVGVTDGYPGYDKFFGRNRQRCWAHIIREADAQSEKTDSPEVRAAGERLKWQMHCAKGPGPPEEAARQHDSRVAETREIAAIYRKEGCDSCATKIDNASEFLYTFTTRPGMDPTNNLAERTLRPGVIARKIRFGLRTKDGQKMFGNMLTCIETWRLRGCNVTDMIRDALVRNPGYVVVCP